MTDRGGAAAGGSLAAVELERVDDRARWDALLAGAGYSPWQQSWAYGAALARRGREVLRLRVEADGRTVGLVQTVGRLMLRGRLGCRHALGGPLWYPGVDAGLAASALLAMKARLGGPARPFVATPALTAARSAKALDVAGMRCVLTGFTTAVLPIASTPQRQWTRLRSSWRHALGPAATVGSLALASRDPRTDPLALDAVLARHEAERRRRGYATVPTGLVADAARRGPCVLATASRDEGLEAFMLFFRHGATATYQVGWTSPLGREERAHQRLLWMALPRLRADGVRLLDLGGLNLPAGIVRFKLASGAVPRTFAGTYV
jgi:hypothetical protein